VFSFSTLEKYINIVKNVTPIDDSFLLKYKTFLVEHDLSIPAKLKTAYHHIVPKSEAKRIGMANYQYNSAQNMVYLSHKDHAIAHILLARAIPTKKNCFIVMQMLSFSKCSNFSDLINNYYEYLVEKYAEIREEANKYISEKQKGRYVREETRNKNKIGRLGKKDSEESRRKKRIARLGKQDRS
jgi:virulence-associated protein VapD